ncbi:MULTISPECIES: (2Fe-2S)-binding protein [unclassified Bosea (in: a-proteobacteria)]|uniref:(2Fe-2S)-binding protein n=1 Tax=Bosea sp. (in: a-proteobacteria) TaxID=1871050 RepID=UPI00086EDA36|nr:(2Fe-2S)-binding protein [Bosea sp. (in: a-proteobacteria)]MBN9467149.1 (2Fe-2S)-binding protein [Bosea sp. (in: a-proteobacteria)]ODT54945.1 MAG: (2Fe-2S)-binding protein [Methylobacterium sp. SCN 67-24]
MPDPRSPVRLSIAVNGSRMEAEVDPRRTLLDFLREDCALTGPKKGCDHGQCGACTVLLDGKRILSCLKLAISAADRSVTTIEGVEREGGLHPIQQAFLDHDALQCGYCTPGQIMSALEAIADPELRTRPQIQEFMSGNICRCGAYNGIVDAIMDVKANASL